MNEVLEECSKAYPVSHHFIISLYKQYLQLAEAALAKNNLQRLTVAQSQKSISLTD